MPAARGRRPARAASSGVRAEEIPSLLMVGGYSEDLGQPPTRLGEPSQLGTEPTRPGPHLGPVGILGDAVGQDLQVPEATDVVRDAIDLGGLAQGLEASSEA